MSNSRDFTDKVVLITGSSSGIGAAAADYFAKCGANVTVTGRNTEKLKKVTVECIKVAPKGEISVHEIVANIVDDDHCKQLINTSIDKFGKLNILINNAGRGVMASIGDEKIMESYDFIMNLNVRSVIFITHLAVPHLEKTRGVIINIWSITGLKPFPMVFPYCMSKSALDMFTICLALELGPKGIRVNCYKVIPAAVRTDGFANMGFSEEIVEKILESGRKQYPLGRVGECSDIVKAMAFLASDDSSFVTGINLVTDGGALWASIGSR